MPASVMQLNSVPDSHIEGQGQGLIHSKIKFALETYLKFSLVF